MDFVIIDITKNTLVVQQSTYPGQLKYEYKTAEQVQYYRTLMYNMGRNSLNLWKIHGLP